jgi:hypothetical protein
LTFAEVISHVEGLQLEVTFQQMVLRLDQSCRSVESGAGRRKHRERRSHQQQEAGQNQENGHKPTETALFLVLNNSLMRMLSLKGRIGELSLSLLGCSEVLLKNIGYFATDSFVHIKEQRLLLSSVIDVSLESNEKTTHEETDNR